MHHVKHFLPTALALVLATSSAPPPAHSLTRTASSEVARTQLTAAAPLTWRDLSGQEYGAGECPAGGATVLVFGSTRCPCADGYTERLMEMARGSASRSVQFFLVFANSAEDDAEVRSYVQRREILFPAVRDADGALAFRLGVAATPTAVVLDARGTVRYRGRVDDNTDPARVKRHDLREALDAVLAGRRVRRTSTPVLGCAITAVADAVPKMAVNGAVAVPPAAGNTWRPHLLKGMGKIDLHVTSRSKQARRFVNQGVALWYGFHFEEAEGSFREAARLDPVCAMAFWGITLALGMNYNTDYDPAREPEAYDAIQTAMRLAPQATPRERAYIAALAKRHTGNAAEALAQRPALLRSYHAEMRNVHAAHPDDIDAAVLFAASGMDLRPWDLWSPTGVPQAGTLAILSALEGALGKAPDHLGAIHYYIHATEASPHPEWATASARRLGKLAPRSGHLVHMPSHTYMRAGDYRAAGDSNRGGADADADYMEREKIGGGYTGYYLHNLTFLVWARTMEGRSREAIAAARELVSRTAQYDPPRMARVCGGPSSLVSVWARFGMWDEILAAAPPPDQDALAHIVWHYARGLALIARQDLNGAEKELQALRDVIPAAEQHLAQSVPNARFAQGFRSGFQIARALFTGKLALAQGRPAEALRAFEEGVAAEDAMPYLEPPMWGAPVRESLGGALLSLGRSADAERVFRADLEHNRLNGRSLFGLMHSLEAQGKSKEAADARAEFKQAWKGADVRLDVAGLWGSGLGTPR